ncbi:hypothetical protein ncot_04545 [Nocardioides sp. JQ2195]|uniref:hypothetical protein n=1 Tax=Nocardioides sp. JQ2195 TaxID=2592334 RepID=UPI00143EC619|nr:hypothetical protein [Nocardioides sp. JQ2195]QIX25950.1 hypothetical protein ncot_04545 [Nocardioides sp. JQ2195]
MHKRHRIVAAVATTMICLTGVSACGSTSDDDSSSNSSESTKNAETITITIKGDTVDPNGKRFDLGINQPVTLEIDADEPGELHVHSKPEQEIAYEAGESSHELTFDKPGIVAVESHTLEKTILEFEVR